MYRRLYRLRQLLRIAGDRLRVHSTRVQGAPGIHGKCLFGAGTRIERPWAVEMGARCVLERDVWLNVQSDTARLRIGEYTFIGRGTEIELTSAITIGRGCLIAPGVYITDHNHGTAAGRPMFQQPCVAAPVDIGEDVWIGASAVILPGVRIGDGAVIGAGAVVTQHVPPLTIAAGVPARPIGLRAAGAPVGGTVNRAR